MREASDLRADPRIDPHRFDAATLATLEFPVVIEQIAAHATCELGAAAAGRLAPMPTRESAMADLSLVDDAVAFMRAGGDFSLAGASDSDDALKGAEIGSALGGDQLAAIARTERALAAAVAAILLGRTPEQPLARLAAQRADTGALVKRLTASLGEDGEVLDAASSELASLRRQKRGAIEEIRRRLDEIVRRESTAKLLSDAIVTVRRGRYVVPVKAEFAGQFPGVVHDQSASGATVFIEPMACVEANNRVRTLEAAEEREVQRVLADLSSMVGGRAGDLRGNASLAARLDSIGARARWAIARAANPPDLDDTRSLRIVRGRHPLLRHEAVPLDVEVGDAFDAVVISGPNMGGKTVVLKTIGLFCLLAYAGIPLPAGAGTRIGWFDGIACAIGDEQSIASDLSSFSAHLRALRSAQRDAGPRSLVLVDEIGSGTEPGAGAALAQAVIESLLRSGARVVVTTHYTQLKAFAASTDRVANASMAFDATTFAPTYVLAMGVPGQSLAFALARSLAVDAQTIERAETLLGAEAADLERAFEGLADERSRLADKVRAAEQEIERLHAAQQLLRAEAAGERDRRIAFEAEAERALRQAVESLRAELLARAERSEEDAQRARRVRALDDAEAGMRGAMRDIRRSLGLERGGAPATVGDPSAGDRVFVRSFGQSAIVSEVYDRDVLVTMGSVKAMVPKDDLSPDPAAPAASAVRSQSGGGPGRMPSLEAATSIDVRGLRVDEAMPIVDKAMDDAALAGLVEIRIIHGKGTGQLRHGIREFLRGHPQVASVADAADREGGTGVTVVTLS